MIASPSLSVIPRSHVSCAKATHGTCNCPTRSSNPTSLTFLAFKHHSDHILLRWLRVPPKSPWPNQSNCWDTCNLGATTRCYRIQLGLPTTCACSLIQSMGNRWFSTFFEAMASRRCNRSQRCFPGRSHWDTKVINHQLVRIPNNNSGKKWLMTHCHCDSQ